MNALTWITGIINVLLLLVNSADSLSLENKTDSSTLSSKIDGFKVGLHRALESLRIRKKRQTEAPYDPSAYQMRVNSYGAEDLPYLEDYQVAFWIPVPHPTQAQVLVGTHDGDLLLFHIFEDDDRKAELLAESNTKEIGLKAKAFNYFDEQWFIVLYSARNQTWISLYVRQGRGLEEQQTITLKGETDFDLVYMKGVYYIAVSSYQSSKNQASITLYHWTQTMFDVIASRAVYGPRSIACWVLDGTLYLALVQRIDGMSTFQYGSPIFLYNAKDDNGLVMQQMLSVVGPTKVLHFYVNSNHYIIFIGNKDASIYWWTSNQFLLWQVIPGTSHAVDASILTLATGEVIIVIVLKEQVLFATLDSSGHYFVSSEMRFDGSNLYSVKFMYSGKAYYALALSSISSYNLKRQPIWKLTWASYFLPTGSSIDSLRQCLNDVADTLDDHQAVMNNIQVDLSRVWLKNKDQKITTEVFIDGKTSSNQKSVVTEILVVLKKKQVLPKLSLPDLDTTWSTLRSIIRKIHKKILGSVRKSVPQDLTGILYFKDPVFIPSLSLKSTYSDIPINDVFVSRIKEFALRSKGSQTFPISTEVSTICVSNLHTDYLNGIKLDDFLLLKGEQIVDGQLTFSNIEIDSIVTNTLNAIPISNLVTISGEQTIRDLKNIKNLRSEAIQVHGETNVVVLREFVSKIVRQDKDEEVKGHITMDAATEILGDLFLIKKINEVFDISQLAAESVLKDTPQELKGLMSFKSNLNILGDVTVSGKINNIDPSQLLTLSSNQIISGPIVFDTLLVVQDNLLTNFINDLNLRDEAVLRVSEPQFVQGVKAFIKVLTSSLIDMTEYTTLDGVDPSMLVQDIVKHKDGLVKQNHTILPHAIVLGDLSVVGGINGRDVFDLPERVLLRKTYQEIEIPVTLKKVATDHMFVTTVNTIDLDSDVVYSYSDDTITSIKSFHNVVALKIAATDNSMINGVQTISYKTELEDFVDEGTIRGKKTISHLEIHGDLTTTTLNNFDVYKNTLRLNDYQVITVPVQFPSQLTVVNDGLKSNSVIFDRFNNQDLGSFLKDPTSKTMSKNILKNKIFSKIKALDLSTLDQSTVNNIRIPEILRRVVTLNTEQEIVGQATFINDSIPNTVKAHNLNGLQFSSLVTELVLLDDDVIVSSKIFNGLFNVPNLFVQQPIDGINIEELSKNAFKKSKNNDVEYPITFANGIEIGNLVIGFGIDGIDWTDMIFLNHEESLESLRLESSPNIISNIFVKGLVNGCDILQLERNALYANKEKQIIQEEITIESIEVIGNVHMENIVNEVPVQNLIRKLILVSDHQEVTSDVVIETGVDATNLNLGSIIEDLNIGFIMNDAVKQSIPQEIKGYKRFHSIVADVLEAPGLFVSNQIQNININELYSGVVWKDGFQPIEGEKIFRSLRTDVATVGGHLNGLKLPEDIVRTDTTEKIISPTFFMSNLILAKDLYIEGKLDGANLTNLLQNRITLSTNQNVFSQLFFRSDVKITGDFDIDGTVNDIVLEMSVKRSHNIPIEGHKVFAGNFNILGSLKAPSVNGYDIQKLDQSVLKHNEEEFVKNLQIFEKPIKAGSHIIVDWINNISLSGITSTFFSLVSAIQKTLGVMEDKSYAILQQLRGQMNTVGDKISKFAYFILLQEINIGPTVKILKGYRLEDSSSAFSHSMVIWTSQKQCSYLEKCCHEEFSHWMRVKKSGHMIVDSQPEPGRLYPIHNPAPVLADKDFFIWTNTTGYQPKWCGNQPDEKMMLASLTELKYLEVFLDIQNASTLSDIKSFRRGHLYAVAGFYYNRKEDVYKNAVVYMFNEIKREWTQQQLLPSVGILSLDIVTSRFNEVLLALGTGTGSYSTVFKWDDNTYKFILLQSISSRFVPSTLWLKQGQTQLLAMANVEVWPNREAFCSELVSGGEINIYAYDIGMKWIQSIPLSGVVSLEYFVLEGDVFLVAASSKLQTVYIYEWKGYMGFSLIQSMFVGEVTHLNTYRIGKDLYMTVATASGPAKVLKVVSQGRQTISTTIHEDLLPNTQKDEAIKAHKTDC